MRLAWSSVSHTGKTLCLGASLSSAAAVKRYRAHRDMDKKKIELSLASSFSPLENVIKSACLRKMKYLLTF